MVESLSPATTHNAQRLDWKPYTPPNNGNGPLTIDKDLCWRVNNSTSGPDLVTPAVVAVVAWAATHGLLKKADHKALLDGLGLEWHQDGIGVTTLRPKHEFRCK